MILPLIALAVVLAATLATLRSGRRSTSRRHRTEGILAHSSRDRRP